MRPGPSGSVSSSCRQPFDVNPPATPRTRRGTRRHPQVQIGRARGRVVLDGNLTEARDLQVRPEWVQVRRCRARMDVLSVRHDAVQAVGRYLPHHRTNSPGGLRNRPSRGRRRGIRTRGRGNERRASGYLGRSVAGYEGVRVEWRHRGGYVLHNSTRTDLMPRQGDGGTNDAGRGDAVTPLDHVVTLRHSPPHVRQ